MKITFLAINYNTYDSLKLFLDSINNAMDVVDPNKKLSAKVFILDNTPIQFKKNFQWVGYRKNLSFNFFNSYSNSGYLGGVELLLTKNLVRDEALSSDYTVISNVDLVLENEFFVKLEKLSINSDVGWIAPSIHSYYENRDRNPKIIKRPKKQKLRTLELIFIHPIIYFIYLGLIYTVKKYKRRKQAINYDRKNIYAGHGSFMIFTNRFINSRIDFKFPSFLFCEEIFFGELVLKEKMKVQFIRDLKIYDSDHASTGELKRKSYCRMNRNSLKVIRKEFFE